MIDGVMAVNTSRAALGIVVDTDVDRSAVVAGNGTPINSNRYIALMSYITLRCSLTGMALSWTQVRGPQVSAMQCQGCLAGALRMTSVLDSMGGS